MKANWHPGDSAARSMRRDSRWNASRRANSNTRSRRSPASSPERVLFTPNFAPRSEYEYGFQKGVRVTLDNLHPIRHWPEVFAGREIFVRIDHGRGPRPSPARAHCRRALQVRHPLTEMDELRRIGAGRRRADRRTARPRGQRHLQCRQLDGNRRIARGAGAGGFREVARRGSWAAVSACRNAPGQTEMDLAALDSGVAGLRRRFPRIEFWMEPGRFLVAKAGVLVAR